MDPSFTLLIDCCRHRLGLLGGASLAERLRGTDGKRVANLAVRHGLEQIVWSALRSSNLALPGTAVLGADARRLVESSRHLADESVRLHRQLATQSLPHLLLGPATLGRLSWDDPLLGRGPIRLLVLVPSLPKVAAALSALGYVQEVPDPSVDPADWHRRARRSRWRSDDGALLDLDGRLSDHPAILATVTASTPAMPVEVGDGQSLPTLPLPLLLSAMALEGTEQAWHRLGWLADFASLVRRFPRAGLEQAVDLAARLGAERPLATALALSHRLLGTDVPDGLWFDRGANRLVKLALTALQESGPPAERWTGRASLLYASLLLQPGSHFFMSAAVRQLARVLTARA